MVDDTASRDATGDGTPTSGRATAAERRKAALDTLLQEYLLVFREFNPGSKVPVLVYERGWFLELSEFNVYNVRNRYRESDLLRMRDNLAQRLAMRDAAPVEDVEFVASPAPGR